MAGSRPAIPRELEREVLVEAGHRCAIPSRRQVPVEIHHIVPWAKAKEHAFRNLIALCPTDHARATKGEIDQRSMLAYKRNLALLNSRYGELERRLLDEFAHNPGLQVVRLPANKDFDFMYLLRDGLLAKGESSKGMYLGNVQIAGIHSYLLTEEGGAFVARWREGQPVEGASEAQVPDAYPVGSGHAADRANVALGPRSSPARSARAASGAFWSVCDQKRPLGGAGTGRSRFRRGLTEPDTHQVPCTLRMLHGEGFGS